MSGSEKSANAVAAAIAVPSFDEPATAEPAAIAAASRSFNEPAAAPKTAATFAVQFFDNLNLEANLIAVLALILFHAFWSGKKQPRSRKAIGHSRRLKQISFLPAEPLSRPSEDQSTTNDVSIKPAISQARPCTAAAAARAAIEPILHTVAEAPP